MRPLRGPQMPLSAFASLLAFQKLFLPLQQRPLTLTFEIYSCPFTVSLCWSSAGRGCLGVSCPLDPQFLYFSLASLLPLHST